MDYVISANLRRRHWSKEKKATVYAKLCNLQRGSNRFESKVIDVQNCTSNTDRTKAAKLAGVSARTISSAKEVVTKGDDSLVKAVESGKLCNLSAATDRGASLRPFPPGAKSYKLPDIRPDALRSA